MDSDIMGPAEPWQIRAFPRKLRQDIVDQAKAERMSPGEFLTQIVVAARNSGWQVNQIANDQTAAAGGVYRVANGQTDHPIAIPDFGPLRDLSESLAKLAEASGEPIGKKLRSRCLRLIDSQVRQALGMSQVKPRTAFLLAGPETATAMGHEP